MSPNRIRQAGLILGFWTLETLYSVAQMHYRMALLPKPYTWMECFRAELIWTTIGLILTPGVLWLAGRFPIDRGHLWRNFAIHMGGAALFASLIKIYWDWFGASKRPSYLTRGFSLDNMLRSISMGFDAGFAIYWGIVLAVLAADYYRRYQAGLVQAAELRTQLVQAQLQALRRQLDPHFLFNTLHSISELVHEDPEAAETMIARLSDLLRRSIENSGAQEVPLQEELELLNLYLEIEKARFDDRLMVNFRIEAGTEMALVPNLVLQPLVENAIRHGIAHRTQGGSVTVSSRREGGDLILAVVDDGAGIVAGRPHREGVGLSSTRGRLERLYGGEKRLELLARERGAEARVRIPYRRESEPIAAPPGHPVPEEAPVSPRAREAHAGD